MEKFDNLVFGKVEETLFNFLNDNCFHGNQLLRRRAVAGHVLIGCSVISIYVLPDKFD